MKDIDIYLKRLNKVFLTLLVVGCTQVCCLGNEKAKKNRARPCSRIKEKIHYTENGEKWIVKQLTHNNVNDYSPQVDEHGNVVWFSGGKHYCYDGNEVFQIPQKRNRFSFDCSGAYISDGKVALREYLGNEKFGIFIFDIKTREKKQILKDFPYRPGPRGHKGCGWPLGPGTNDWFSFYISIDKGKIAFASWDGTDYEIFYWDGKKLRQITDNDFDDYFPILSNGQISYVQRRGVFKINLWDGRKNIRLTSWPKNKKHIDDISQQVDHFIDNGRVVFASFNIGDKKSKSNGMNIVLWDKGVFKFISSNPFVNLRPIISEDLIIWSGWHKNNKASKYWQVYLWNGKKVDNLTNNNTVNKIGGLKNGWVTWAQYDGRDFEIMLARKAKN